MTSRPTLCLLTLASMAVAANPALPQSSSSTAFVNVNVIPMDSERVLEGYTVVVQEGRIVALGEVDQVNVPAGAHVINGAGAYLMPGLADMHLHLTFDADPNSMRLYLAQGVTTVRNLNAVPAQLAWRERVLSGEILGPTIYTSGPTIVGLPPDFRSMRYSFWAILILGPVVAGLLILFLLWLASKYFGLVADFGRVRRYAWPTLAGLLLVGMVVAWLKIIPLNVYTSLSLPMGAVSETEAQARQFVRDQKSAGVDLIKVYDFLPRDIYFAAVDEGHQQGIYVAGHIPDQPEVVSVQDIVEAGQNEVVHVDEFTHEFWVDYDPIASDEGWVEYDIDMSRVDEVAALVAENDIAVTLTLVTNEMVVMGLEDRPALLERPEYRVIRPDRLEAWKTRGRFVNWVGQEGYRRDVWRPLLLQLTKALHEQGALLALGTDVDVEGVVPGFSVHQELALLVEAGLTPFEALATGTRNAARIAKRMGQDAEWGTIEEEHRADLILLPMNPLEDVTHTRDRLGVMVRGQWFTQPELDTLVDTFVATY